RLAQRLADAVRAHSSFSLEAPVELSAVCFRYVADSKLPVEKQNRLSQELLKRVNRRGKIYLSNATLSGRFCLRACLVNHCTPEKDVDSVIPEVLSAAHGVA